jgi:hypothetical protein
MCNAGMNTLPCVTSINDISNKNISLFPNPVYDYLNISIAIFLLPFISDEQINLIPNQNFKNTISCPHYTNQMAYAAYW